MPNEPIDMQGETELPWLGARRFWVAFAALAVLGVAALWAVNARISRAEATVPVIVLSGPRQAAPGESTRYAVLVRDRFAAAIPEALVRVGFWKNALVELARGRTDEGGELTVDVQFPADFTDPRSLVAVTDVGVVTASDDIVIESRPAVAGRVVISTDKPLYQPGQMLHLRALAMAGDRPAADKATVVEIATSDGLKVFRAEKPTSAFGVVSVDFALADQVKFGTYHVEVTTQLAPEVTAKGRAEVEVKRYALPKVTLRLDDVSSFSASDPLRGEAHAQWVFGEPVKKGTFTASLERSGTVERTTTGQVDERGAIRFELAAPARPPATPAATAQPPATFTLRLRLEVEGGLAVEATREVRPLGAGIVLEAFPESGAVAPGVLQTIFVVAKHTERAGIEVRTDDGDKIAQTSELGIATLHVLPAARSDRFVVHASALDGSEGKLEVPVVATALVVRPDRDAYAAGETAKVRVLGAAYGDRVTVRVSKGERAVASGSCVVDKPADGCQAAIPLPTGTSGLTWIHALSLPAARDHAVKAGKRLVLTGVGSRDLAIAVTADKRVHAPRETGAIDVSVTGPTGAPVKALLGVAVADEAVFALADVRPDLERLVLSVYPDLAGARRREDRYHDYTHPPLAAREATMPSSPQGAAYDPSAAFEATAPADVRGAILAALTTMPAAGGFSATTSAEVAFRATEAVRRQTRRNEAWFIVLLGAFAAATFGAFGLYGVTRLRRPRPSPLDDEARAAFQRETRGLVLDWLVAIFAPPLLGVLSVYSAKVLVREPSPPGVAMVGAWTMVAILCSSQLSRAVLRVRRTRVAGEAATLRRSLSLLPAAVLLGHLAIVLAAADAWGGRLRQLLGVRQGLLLVPLVVVAAVQVTSALLSVVRQTTLRALPPRRPLLLFATGAAFVGLPLTLLAAAGWVVVAVKQRSEARWDGFSMEQAEQESEQVEESNADNKEGGSGARAKGEEGSMGGLGGHHYGARGSAPTVVRDFFPETLLWAPEVMTDDAGRAKIEVPFADSITTWRLGLRAVGRDGQLGSATMPLVVTQDFFVDAALPAVLTQGDELAVPVTVHGYTEAEQDVTVEIEGDGVSFVGPASAKLRVAPGEARGLSFTLRADKAGEREWCA